jgi:hypothetical protein
LLAVAPVLTVLALRLPLINQLDYADAWFYSAYAWVPKHHFAVFPWNYFAVRFPAILSIGVFDRLFGAEGGYFVLRYLLAVGSGGALYMGVRRFAAAPVAAGAVLLLFLNPFFSRMLLWDYAGFVAVAGGVIGFALWYWSDGRAVGWSLLPGSALAIAVFANALAATAVFTLLLVELVAAARRGRKPLITLAARLGVCVIGGVGVFVVGYIGYLALLGSLSPADLLRPTIRFLADNGQNAAPYRQGTGRWLLHDPRIWAPVVLSAALVAALGRRVLGTDLQARCAQVCVAYTLLLWLYRFAVTSSVVETWWAYNVVVIAMAPGTGALLHELARGEQSALRRSTLAVGVAAGVALLVRDVPGPAVDAYAWLSAHAAALLALLAATAAVVVTITVRVRAVRLLGLLGAIAAVQVLAYAPSIFDGRGGTGVFVRSGDLEWAAYPAGKRLVELIRDHEGRGRHVFVWSRGIAGLPNIVWADLPQYGSTVNQVGVDESMARLRPLGRARLLQPQATSVLVLSERSGDLRSATRALVGAGFGERFVTRGSLADGGLHYLLLELTRKP